MKVAILTFNTAINFGAQLQAYALQKTLVGMGHEALHIRRKQVNARKRLKAKIKDVLAASRNEKYNRFMNEQLSFFPGEYSLGGGII